MKTREELLKWLEERKPKAAQKRVSELLRNAEAEMRLYARAHAVTAAVDALQSSSTVELAVRTIQHDMHEKASAPESSTSSLGNIYDRMVLAEYALVLRDMLFWRTP